MDNVGGSYNDGNRAFLQAFMARGTLTFEEGKKILAAIFTILEEQETSPDDVTQEDFDSYISAAADALSAFDYEIRSSQHQVSKQRVYALVNSISDPLTQMATIKTPEEIGFIKRMLDAMFETKNTRRREVMAVTGLEASKRDILRGTGSRQSLESGTQSQDRGLTGEQAERTLASLVAEGWFERSKEGYYTLSPRALMELRSWLVDTYNDSDDPEDWQRIKLCQACKEIVTVGQRCKAMECNVRLHDVCQAAYWNSRPSKKCPKCETSWEGKQFVGQMVETSTEDYLKGKRRSGGTAKRRQEVEEEPEASEENEENEEPEEPGEAEEDMEEDE